MKLVHIFAVLIFSLFIYSVSSTATAGKRLHTEAFYQKIWCEQQLGITEYVLFDRSRVDCLLRDYAVEADFADKAWKEGVGQAFWYSLVTRRYPGILVIVESADDCRYVERLRDMTRFLHPEIATWQTGAYAYLCPGDL